MIVKTPRSTTSKKVVEKPVKRKAGKPTSVSRRKSRAIADRAHEQGLSPLEFLLKIMWTESERNWTDKLKSDHEALRVQVAIACLPYMHPKLQNITYNPGGAKEEVPPQITYAVDAEANDENTSD